MANVKITHYTQVGTPDVEEESKVLDVGTQPPWVPHILEGGGIISISYPDEARTVVYERDGVW